MTKYNEYTYNVNGEDVRVWRIDNDTNGNPRYVVHFLSLGLKDYCSIAGLTKMHLYRAKWFGGGYVFQSYNVKHDLEVAIKALKA